MDSSKEIGITQNTYIKGGGHENTPPKIDSFKTTAPRSGLAHPSFSFTSKFQCLTVNSRRGSNQGRRGLIGRPTPLEP